MPKPKNEQKNVNKLKAAANLINKPARKRLPKAPENEQAAKLIDKAKQFPEKNDQPSAIEILRRPVPRQKT